MKMSQAYDIVNKATAEIEGLTGIINEDLSNTVDLGEAVYSSEDNVNKYAKGLVDQVGKMVFVDRVYRGGAPSVLMDGWEYGSILQKVREKDLPEATENESWELSNGTSYDPNIYYGTEVTCKFYNQRITFEVPRSFTDIQLKESFQNGTQMAAFIAMLYTNVENSMTVKLDALVMRTINNMTAETIYSEYQGAGLGTKSGTRAINLLYLYNQKHPNAQLTVDNCLESLDFNRFAVNHMNKTVIRLGKSSRLFNVGGSEKFTPKEDLKFITLVDFTSAADVYLQSPTFHDEYTKLPGHEDVAYWQGSGTEYDFADISAIDVKTASNNTVQAAGILAVMFDRNALGVTNMNRRTTSYYNAKAEFWNNWFKMDAGYFNDLDENFVVFFVA